MALIKCPECGRENVSEHAYNCPNCGYPINRNVITPSTSETVISTSQKANTQKQIIIFIIISIFVTLLCFAFYRASRCKYPGCHNTKLKSSDYCSKHYTKSTYSYSNSGRASSYTAYTTENTTTGNEGAVNKAKSYLKHTAFSYSGLIDQLEYEGFSHSEATYGADHCNADWDEQAVNKAKSYISHTAFSYSGMIEQLEYEGFTESQAKHGADKCGADWYEQAVKKAKSYREHSNNMDGSRLIEQLEYEGFTYDQASYGEKNSK